MQVVAASGEVVLMTALLGLGTIATRLPSGHAWRDRRLWATLVGAAAFGVLLSAVQWLPTLALAREVGTRLTASRRFNEYWSVHPLSLLDFFVPTATSQFPWNDAWRTRLFEAREPLFEVTYLGVTTLGLVLLAVLGRRDRVARALAMALALFVLAALGKHTPVLSVLLTLKPLALFRYPVKALVGVGFVWGLLVAAGLDLWARPWGAAERRRAVWCAGVLAGLGLAAIVGRGFLDESVLGAAAAAGTAPLGGAQSRLARTALFAAAGVVLIALRSTRVEAPRWLTGALVLVVVADVSAITRKSFLVGPTEMLTSRPPILSAFGDRLDGTRLYVDTHDPEWQTRQMVRRLPGWPPHASWELGYQHYLFPPIGARWRLAGSFDGDFTGQTPPPIPRLTEILQSASPADASRLLRLGSVDYVVSMSVPSAIGVREVGAFLSVYSKPLRVFRVPDPLPRAYLVGGTHVVPDEQAVAALLDPAFDPASAVIVGDGTETPAAPGFRGSVRAVARTFRRLTFDTDATHPALLVVVETYASGWRAAVDGAPVPVRRANAAFRAVAVPAGTHRVEMWYRPLPVVAGMLLSVGALLAAAVWLISKRGQASARHLPS
jgi:membrane protein YfhO